MVKRVKDYVDKSQLRKLGRDAYLSLEEYVNKYGGKLSSSQRVNKFYADLYLKIVSDYPELKNRALPSQNAPEKAQSSKLEETLKKIPIKVISIMFPKKSTANEKKILKNGFTTVWDIYNYNSTGSKRAYKAHIEEWRCILQDEAVVSQVISAWQVLQAQHVREFPQEIDKENGLPIDMIVNAVKELILGLRKIIANPPITFKIQRINEMKRIVEKLDGYYLQKKDDKTIANELACTYENVRKPRKEIINRFIRGEVLYESFKIKQEVLKLIKDIQKQCIYESEKNLNKKLGCSNDDRINDLLGFDFVDVVEGVRFVIPKKSNGELEFTKNDYIQVSKAFLSVLRETVSPIDEETIYARINQLKIQSMTPFEYDPAFVEKLLSCKNLISKRKVASGDGVKILYALKTEYLATAEQKLARIIFDNAKCISFEEAKRIYQEKYRRETTVGKKQLRKFGLYCDHDNRLSIKEFVEKYTEEKIIFYYSDIKKAIDQVYYENQNERSIRTYITNNCAVDNKDGSHFCHKDYVDDYPEFSWRSSPHDGVANWVIKRIKDVLEKCDGIKLEDLSAHIMAMSKGTEYDGCVRRHINTSIRRYSGPDRPFILDGDVLKKNDAVFATTNFQTLALRGDKYPVYILIRDIVLKKMKKTPDGKILLVDVIKLVNSTLPEPQDRNTILRAIKNTHLPDIGLEIKNINGYLYIMCKDKANDGESSGA